MSVSDEGDYLPSEIEPDDLEELNRNEALDYKDEDEYFFSGVVDLDDEDEIEEKEEN